jgi:hypothetical protein
VLSTREVGAVFDVFETLKERAKEKTRESDPDNFRVRGLWKMELLFRPTIHERTFSYTVLLAQTLGQGCCYSDPDHTLDPSLLGEDAWSHIGGRGCTSIALLDSIYASIPKHPAESHELRGNSVEKTQKRNSILVAEAERLISGRPGGDVHLVNVGVVGDLIKKLKDRGHSVLATDLDTELVGKTIHGVNVKHGSRTLEYVKCCDVAIVTGMTLSTNTLDEIFVAALEHDTRILLFAETGANFAEEYCCTIGIDAVISEPFPFYIFQGVSTIEVYRKS